MGIDTTNQSANQVSLVTKNRSLSKKEIRTKFLNDFKSRIDSGADKLYLFYARPYAYDNSDDSPTGDNPPFPVDSVNDDSEARKAIMALRRIRADDTTNAFVRNNGGTIISDWSSGKIYDQYSNLTDLSTKQFYAFANDKIYICLNNNGGRTSTVEPSANDGAPFDTSDGYRWKLLIDYLASRLRKFNSSTHLPIPPQSSTEIKQSKDGGQVERLDLDVDATNSPAASPSGYSYITDLDSPVDLNSPQSREQIPLFIKGDGDDVRTATATAFTVVANALTAIDETHVNFNGGSGYYNDIVRNTVPVEIRLSTGTKGGSYREAYGIATVSSTGVITKVKIVNGGNGFPSSGTLTIVQSSAIAYANVDVSTGMIIDNSATIKPFDIEQSGKNFTKADVISVVDDSSTSADSSIDVILSPVAGHGSNLKTELSATSLFINVRVTSGIEEFTNTNDFRQIGIIANPKTTAKPPANIIENFVDASSSILVTEGVSSVFGDISADATIEGRTTLHKARLVDVLDTTTASIKKVRFLTDPGESISNIFSAGETVDITGGGSNGFIIESSNSVTATTFDRFSGDILYINNSNSIQRSASQSETINFIFNF